MRLCSQALLPAGWGGLYIPEGEVTFFPTSREELTHTKCSLCIRLKALGTANFIFLCKANGKSLREPVPQGILGLFIGLVQAVGPGWELNLCFEPDV